MAYINCGGPPEDIIKLVETRLKQRNLKGIKLCATLSSSSADEMLNSPVSVTFLFIFLFFIFLNFFWFI
ncbi:hypothetical protein Hanom_Chr05g00429381 [Helianthus anomalus]